jgi:hypothetical protein
LRRPARALGDQGGDNLHLSAPEHRQLCE